MVEKLLHVNPEAAKYRSPNGNSLLHFVCGLPSKLCIDTMKLILALHKDAVQEADEEGLLSVHHVATWSDVEVLDFLLGLCPELASVVTSDGDNLLHLAVDFIGSSMSLSKVRYLSSRYPAMLQQRNDCGEMPIHKVAWSRGWEAFPVLYAAGGIEQFKTPTTPQTDDENDDCGSLPIFRFVTYHSMCICPGSSYVPEAADMFCWLLSLYPEAAAIEGGVGTRKQTLYQLAVDRKLPDCYLRLLLRAAPTLDPAELHLLNYAERRMAMFLAFKATTARLKTPFLLTRFRDGSKDLIQRVVSFL
jgi:hypothetical protein